MSVIANVEMAKAWDGEEGDDWTQHAAGYEAADQLIWAHFQAEVPIASTDRVLDIGCGTGASSRAAARAAHEGSVLGVDLSSKMLEYARRQSDAAGLTNVEFVQADAQVHPFQQRAFDIAISAFGMMFFGDPVAAFANVGSALRPGGRLATTAWQAFERNEWLSSIVGALVGGRERPAPPTGVPGPFGLAEPDLVERVLAEAGYEAVELVAVHEPVYLGPNADEAWGFVSGLGVVRGLTADLDDAERAGAMARLRQAVDEHETPDGVLFGSAAWLIKAARP
jgi:SAM-dependent methyltransferase